MTEAASPERATGRGDIIASITSPLALFALIALIIEVLLGAIATQATGTDLTVLIYGMLGSFLLLLILIAVLLVVRGTSILETVHSRPNSDSAHSAFVITLAPPEDMAGFEFAEVSWNHEKCFVRCADAKVRVKPAFGAGAAFEVRLPPEIVSKASDTEPVEVELCDEKGNLWRVRPFFLSHRSVVLSFGTSKQQIIASYGRAP